MRSWRKLAVRGGKVAVRMVSELTPVDHHKHAGACVAASSSFYSARQTLRGRKVLGKDLKGPDRHAEPGVDRGIADQDSRVEGIFS